MATAKVPLRSAASELSKLLDSPEIRQLVAELEATRETGRPGYGSRAMIGVALVKSLYGFSTWTRTVALIREHAALREALGCGASPPSHWAAYRFAAKLRRYSHLLEGCVARITAALHERHPDLGRDLAIDASDLPAYANGQRFVSKGGRERERYSDLDASWGHRSAVSTRKGGGFYGFKLHAAVCARTGLPLAWRVETGRANEAPFATPLIDAVRNRGFVAETCALDKGYDLASIYRELENRDCRPIIPLRQTPDVKRGADRPPCCEHGEWRFAGSDYARRAAKWRCPTGECKPGSRWVKADRLHPLIPRESPRWWKLYRGRAAVEREFGRLKHEWSLTPLRVRGLSHVRLHADLTLLARLSCALARSRTVALAARAGEASDVIAKVAVLLPRQVEPEDPP